MIIKKVTKKYLLDIWLWKNDKLTTLFSKKKKVISFDEHSKWFNKTLNSVKTKFYIGLYIGRNKNIKKKIGVVRFDVKNRYALVSINLNPVMRGKKLSHILLSEAIKKFIKFKKTILIAEIKKNNLASINCFLKNKFYFYRSKNKYRLYKRSLG
jgi:L-amino acid N-acyltransferase YncA